MEKIEYFQILLNTQEVIWPRGSRRDFGGGNLELFTNFFEYERLYPNDPCSRFHWSAPNLSTGRATCTLARARRRNFIDVRDLFKKLMSGSQRVLRNSPHDLQSRRRASVGLKANARVRACIIRTNEVEAPVHAGGFSLG